MLRKYKYMALGCLTYVPGSHAALRQAPGQGHSIGLDKDALAIAEPSPGRSRFSRCLSAVPQVSWEFLDTCVASQDS